MTKDRLSTDLASIRPHVPGELLFHMPESVTTGVRVMRFAQHSYRERDVPPLDFHFLGVGTGKHDVRWRTIDDWQHVRTNQPIAFFMPAGIGSRWSNGGALDAHHVYLAPIRVNSLVPDLRTPFEELLPRCFTGPWIVALNERLAALSAERNPLSALATDTLILSIVTVVFNARLYQTKPDRRARLAPWQLRRLTTKLLDELDRDVSLDELAALVRLSPTYLCTAFRDSTGLPPHQWQKQARVERAKTLLETETSSVTEIALEVGYSNPGHFATMFRTATGLTPRAWRRERTR